MTIASVNAGPDQVLRYGWDTPPDEAAVLEQLARTLVALEPHLRILRCCLRAGVFQDDADGYEDVEATVTPAERLLLTATPPSTVEPLGESAPALTLPELTGAAVVDQARSMLSGARASAPGRIALGSLYADALALRAPADTAPEGDITLETWSGERWVPVVRRDGEIWFAGPWLGGVVPTPGVLRITRIGRALDLALTVNWSLWSRPGEPAWPIVALMAEQLMRLGWEKG